MLAATFALDRKIAAGRCPGIEMARAGFASYQCPAKSAVPIKMQDVVRLARSSCRAKRLMHRLQRRRTQNI
jgi:hypothetical protein